VENLITIELFGRCYTFKTESDVARAKAVADSLVKEVVRIQEKESGGSLELTNLTILILAALNIADENFELKHNQAQLLNKVAQKSDHLLRLIDSGFK
jgi:cell division protein ZapA (FtsZ GTPase activity inhibitor)